MHIRNPPPPKKIDRTDKDSTAKDKKRGELCDIYLTALLLRESPIPCRSTSDHFPHDCAYARFSRLDYLRKPITILIGDIDGDETTLLRRILGSCIEEASITPFESNYLVLDGKFLDPYLLHSCVSRVRGKCCTRPPARSTSRWVKGCHQYNASTGIAISLSGVLTLANLGDYRRLQSFFHRRT